MAKAKKIPAQTKTEVVEISPATVTLELSLEEAKMLTALTGRLAGNGGLSTQVYNALVYVLNDRSYREWDIFTKSVAYTEPWVPFTGALQMQKTS
jgi:hypothetical protein